MDIKIIKETCNIIKNTLVNIKKSVFINYQSWLILLISILIITKNDLLKQCSMKISSMPLTEEERRIKRQEYYQNYKNKAKKYYEEKKNEIKEKYENNKDEIRKKQKAYYEKNKEKKGFSKLKVI
jgi:hypothetical protein